MNYLKLNSARYILETVAKWDGEWTWYNIVKYVDQKGDSEKDPTSYQVLQELSANEFLRTEVFEGNKKKYFITDKGKQFLSEHQVTVKV